LLKKLSLFLGILITLPISSSEEANTPQETVLANKAKKCLKSDSFESKAETIQVSKEVFLDRPEIRLRDIFLNLPDHPKYDLCLDARVTYAKPIKMTSRQLRLLARKYQIHWSPPINFLRCTIRRRGTRVALKDLESDLKKSLLISEETPIKINHWPRIIVADPKECSIGKIQNNPKTQLFSAEILAKPANSGEAKTFRVYGRILEEIHVPVLKETQYPGHIIGEKDIKTLKLSKQKTHYNTLMKKSDIIGLTPKRKLVAEVPLRKGDVVKPIKPQKSTGLMFLKRKD
jgi:hypothetical protein